MNIRTEQLMALVERSPESDSEPGVRLLFNIVDPTGMLTGSKASELALNGVASIVSSLLSTHEDLHK